MVFPSPKRNLVGEKPPKSHFNPLGFDPQPSLLPVKSIGLVRICLPCARPCLPPCTRHRPLPAAGALSVAAVVARGHSEKKNVLTWLIFCASVCSFPVFLKVCLCHCLSLFVHIVLTKGLKLEPPRVVVVT